ncbi:hypothetical protein B0H13DRAFT_1901448 [Mycena leptocephala]|nr:hypothetical protein B0H13DRAFT_1901448 [Mycena leptocephala]
MSTIDPSISNQTLGYLNDLCEQTVKDVYEALFDALSDPDMSETFNPDVLGYGVRLSTDFSSLSKGILIRWGSAKDAQDALRSTLFQIGAIVLCTLISIVRDQLYFFDGLFTLMYILWINGHELYFWICRPIPANPSLCLALVCEWISLNLVHQLLDLLETTHRRQPPQVDKSTRCLQTCIIACAIKNSVFTHHKWPFYVLIINSYWNWSYSLTLNIKLSQSLSVVAAATSIYPVFKLLIGLRKLRAEDISRIYFSFISELVFLFFGSVAIPLIQVDSTASGGNTLSAVGESSSGQAPSAYLYVPIPSSEMDITTVPLPLHEGEVPLTHAPTPGEEDTLPSVPRSAPPLQPPTSEPANTLFSVHREHNTQVLAQTQQTTSDVVQMYPAQLAIPRACPHRSFKAH